MMIHTWLWHFSQGSGEYPSQHASRKDFWSPVEKNNSINRLHKPAPSVLCLNKPVLLPGTTDRSTPPALVSGGRRAHQEPAAASCISLAKPRSASRWHSRRRAGKLHYQHHHSAPRTHSRASLQLDTTHVFTCLHRAESAIIWPAAQGRRPGESRSRCSWSHHWTCSH